MSELCDVGAERAVLAGIFQYGNLGLLEVSDIINSKTFTIESNKLIYNCAEHAIKNNPQLDIPVFLSAAHDLGFSEHFCEKVEIEYLRSLSNFPIEFENIRGQAKKIKKLEITRGYESKLRQASNNLKKITGNETVSEIVAIAERPIFDFAKEFNGDDDRPKLIGENINDYVEFLKNNPNRQIGIPTPWYKFNKAVGGGLRRKTVTLIGTRTGVGKSTLGDNVGLYTSDKLGIPTLMLDTEMSEEEHQERLLANISRIPIDVIAEGRFVGNKYQEEKITAAAKKMSKLPYTYKSIAGKKFEEVLSIIRRWIFQEVGFENGRTKDCLIIYDYFKLMDSSQLGDLQEFQAIGFQISDMHNFCVEYDVPVLSFVQLNRDGIEKELTSTISQSDRLVWLATTVAIFKVKTEEEIQEAGELEGNRKMILVKTRHGKGLDEGNYINMNMQGEYCSIIELRTKAEVYAGSRCGGFEIDESTENRQD